jgi:hypothetical protein
MVACLQDHRCLRPDPKPNYRISRFIHQVASVAIDDQDYESKTELDSHANMVVVGMHSHILAYTGQTVSVNPFTPDYDALPDVPIVDAAIMYDCPYPLRSVVMIVQNALYVPSMELNLIPPFIMREANIVVNDVPKIHATDPSVTDHLLWFPAANLQVPLLLCGIFLYFATRKPTLEELCECEHVVSLTLAGHTWDPNSNSYARNKESMLDWEGNMTQPQDCLWIMVKNLPKPDSHGLDFTILAIKTQAIDSRFIDDDIGPAEDCGQSSNTTVSIHAELSNISLIYCPAQLCSLLTDRRVASGFACSVGSTSIASQRPLTMATIPEEESVDADALLPEDLEDIYDFANNIFGLKNPSCWVHYCL